MINADELTEMIKAQAHLTDDPPISTEAIQDAADNALRLWGDSEGPQPITSAA
ncbi:hypothetical protein [Nonomuraea rubra]|uniref:hypothetical protein n=1 Tax=Nonomuraea rubra TaxID=46180 RepID=UPI0033E68D61